MLPKLRKVSPLHFKAAIKCHVFNRREKRVFLTIVEKLPTRGRKEWTQKAGEGLQSWSLWALLSGSLFYAEPPWIGLMGRPIKFHTPKNAVVFLEKFLTKQNKTKPSMSGLLSNAMRGGKEKASEGKAKSW